MRERERRLIEQQHRMQQLVAAMRSRLVPPLPGKARTRLSTFTEDENRVA